MIRKLYFMSMALAMLLLSSVIVLAAVPPKDGLLLYYSFDDVKGNTIRDGSDHEFNGSIIGSVTQVDGVYGKALRFDGEENYVTLSGKLFDKATTYSVSAWIRINEIANWSRIFDFGSDTDNYTMLSPVSGGNTTWFELKTNGIRDYTEISEGVPEGSWTHVATVYTGSSLILYIGGEEVATTDISPDCEFQVLWNNESNSLGKSQWPDPLFNGDIDEFLVYSRVLSPAEIAVLAKR